MCSQQSKGAKYPQKSFNCADAFSIKITRFHAALKPIFRSLKPFQAFSSLLNLGARDFSFYMNTHIDLVIDRTETDVLLGNSKGIYQAEDLNRVGQAVEELAALLPQLDLQTAVAPKTDWAPPEAYDPDKWIRTANMAVYLANVTTLLSTMGILAPADFPVDMNFLTYRGANAIEKALLQVHDRICSIQNAYQYSGAAYAGEETGL